MNFFKILAIMIFSFWSWGGMAFAESAGVFHGLPLGTQNPRYPDSSGPAHPDGTFKGERKVADVDGEDPPLYPQPNANDAKKYAVVCPPPPPIYLAIGSETPMHGTSMPPKTMKRWADEFRDQALKEEDEDKAFALLKCATYINFNWRWMDDEKKKELKDRYKDIGTGRDLTDPEVRDFWTEHIPTDPGSETKEEKDARKKIEEKFKQQSQKQERDSSRNNHSLNKFQDLVAYIESELTDKLLSFGGNYRISIRNKVGVTLYSKLVSSPRETQQPTPKTSSFQQLLQTSQLQSDSFTESNSQTSKTTTVKPLIQLLRPQLLR